MQENARSDSASDWGFDRLGLCSFLSLDMIGVYTFSGPFKIDYLYDAPLYH